MAKAKKEKPEEIEVAPDVVEETVPEEEMADSQKWDERIDPNPNDQQINERL